MLTRSECVAPTCFLTTQREKYLAKRENHIVY